MWSFGFLILIFYVDTLKLLDSHPLKKRERGNNRVHTITFNFACLFIVYYFELQLTCFVTQVIQILLDACRFTLMHLFRHSYVLFLIDLFFVSTTAELCLPLTQKNTGKERQFD